MTGAVALWYSGDYLFGMLPALRQIWAATGVRQTWISDFVSAYGVWIWVAGAAGTGVSLVLGFLKPGRPLSCAMSASTFILTLALAWMVNRGAWGPWVNLMLDLADPGREIPRRN